jgi:lipopolysaccharide transport system ATP-binding protein
MSDIVISVENLSKRYLIGHQSAQREDYNALRDVIGREARNFARKAVDLMRGRQIIQGDDVEELWALKGVSFDVKQGEVVGIIGRNGAGKSTLLKILSRITEPTEGEVRLRGRVGSLLEVGTGFHPELSGRENIFLNGAILGMNRREIVRKFDEIVAFAEVERFIDTPVKRYSSGMYVRLAFAVAAHLEPEILIVDEVLAVGDAEFQKKCLGKIGEVARGGRTVLFVSHSMATINRLCPRCLLLETGQLIMDDDVDLVTSKYLISDTGTTAARRWSADVRRPGDEVACLIALEVRQKGKVADTVDIRYPVDIEMTYEVFKDEAKLLSAFSFFDSLGVHLFVSGDLNDAEWSVPRPHGIYKSICRVPGNLFSEGVVRVVPEVSTRHPVYHIHFIVFDCVAFQVVDTGEPGSVRGAWGRPIPGAMRPMCEWQTVAAKEAAHSALARVSTRTLS